MFYVYTLSDPRDGSVFYIGKGKGLRMHQHLVEATKDNGRGNRRKIERIKAIVAAGLRPVAAKVAEHECEQDAFDHEAELIAATPGLTNILARGGGWALTKEEAKRRLAERQAKWLELEKQKIRKRIEVWDQWERDGLVICFPGVEVGGDLAAALVAAVRSFAA